MTYEEKVKLYRARRYLMPVAPIGTKNWTMRDYIRFIDQHGRWCPGSHATACELDSTGSGRS